MSPVGVTRRGTQRACVECPHHSGAAGRQSGAGCPPHVQSSSVTDSQHSGLRTRPIRACARYFRKRLSRRSASANKTSASDQSCRGWSVTGPTGIPKT